MVPDIKGQHYRLDKDGWNYLASKYKISGIPRYMLFDKSGKLINDNLGFHSNEELKELFDRYLK